MADSKISGTKIGLTILAAVVLFVIGTIVVTGPSERLDDENEAAPVADSTNAPNSASSESRDTSVEPATGRHHSVSARIEFENSPRFFISIIWKLQSVVDACKRHRLVRIR